MLRDCPRCDELVVITDGVSEQCECGAWVGVEDTYGLGPSDQEVWDVE